MKTTSGEIAVILATQEQRKWIEAKLAERDVALAKERAIAANPNAGVVQAYPNGRFSSEHRGWV